jgi:serine/threonine-protein kinase
MLVLAGVLGLVFVLSTGALGSLFAGFGSIGGVGPERPPATLTPGATTATPETGVAVPDLTNFTDVAADQTLRQLQLVPVRLTQNDPLVAASRVISQEIAPGLLLQPGQPVTYTVSLGPQPVQVVELDDVTRLPAALARQRLEGLGFLVEVIEQPSATVDAGFVISQSPSAGLRLPQGQSVTIRVSQGDVVRFPDIIGLQREEAERILRDTPGLELVFVDEQGRDKLGADYDRYNVNQVVSAQIENNRGLNNGDLVPRGSRIVIGVKRAE